MKTITTLYGFSREGIAAIYGSDAIYKVYSVMVVPSLKKDASKEKNSQQGDKKQNKGSRTFGNLLNSEQEKVREREITVASAGYTKDLRPISMLYRTHEYF